MTSTADTITLPTLVSDRARDYLDIDGLLVAEELALRDRVRAFVDERIRPNIADWYATATFPRELVKEIGALGLLGMHLKGYGCAGRSAVEYGLAAMELEAGDSGIRTFVSVQGSLAMSAISKLGSEEQKQRWLPGMATGDLIGCFGLTEPTAGSDPASMVTTRSATATTGCITGAKRWIGLAYDRRRRDHLGQDRRGRLRRIHPRLRRPTDTPGFTATPIEPKLSMRASIQCDIVLDQVRLPADAVLPGATGLKGPFSCLNEARYGIMWGAMGAARDAYETALRYALGAASSAGPSRRSSSPSKNWSTWCWRSRRASRSRCTPGASRTPARCGPSRSPSASSTTSARPSRSAARPAPFSAATASPSTTRRCGTPTTWKASAPTRAPTRSTP